VLKAQGDCTVERGLVHPGWMGFIWEVRRCGEVLGHCSPASIAIECAGFFMALRERGSQCLLCAVASVTR
jgi:hypothetical protein